MLIDSHAHLTDERYGGASEIIASMRTDGLEKIVTVGYDLQSSKQAVSLAEANRDVYAAVGFHPSETGKITDGDLGEILALSRRDKTVAVGEIGLDYYYDDTDRPTQLKCLEAQLDVVDRSGLPVIFHIRDAYADMLDVLTRNRHKLRAGGVAHCFSGSLETAKIYLDMGLYISFSGSITFKNAVKFPEIIRAVPSDRILVETDCPYLTPVPFRGKLNYPAYVKYQAEKIAEVRGETVSAVEEYTRENTYRLFSKMKREG